MSQTVYGWQGSGSRRTREEDAEPEGFPSWGRTHLQPHAIPSTEPVVKVCGGAALDEGDAEMNTLLSETRFRGGGGSSQKIAPVSVLQ